MDIKKYQDLYERADNLPKKIEGVTAYGCGCSQEGEIAAVAVDVLMDFYDWIAENYEDNNTPDWAEAYIQLYSWQFQCFHEGIFTYYENFYEHTGKENTLKAVAYLQEIGFQELADVMKKGLTDDSLEGITEWIDSHDELIYTAYLKIIEQSKIVTVQPVD
ncbi:MAG: hypothetical protein K2N51_11055 [Lachnospiraceae bacterium]|nr:hypothetical protein [Lachnospiraceae bacterium]